MTFKPSFQKVILRTRSTPQIERVRSVSGTLPKEVRAAFEKKNQVIVAGSERVSTEKLMPCGMRYPEPFRARPNFWIPIIYVSSFVIPFFMMWLINLGIEIVHGTGWLVDFVHAHGPRIQLQNRHEKWCLALSFMFSPLIAGVLWSYCLTKVRMRMKLKLVAWIVPMLIFCFLDYIALLCFKFPF